MTTNELLTDLHSRGVMLRAVGDRLKIDAPAGALTDAALAELRARKAELLATLATGHFCPGCGSDALKLQDKTYDAWFCSDCRRWCNSQGGPVAEVETVRPLTLEEVEARARETEAVPEWVM